MHGQPQMAQMVLIKCFCHMVCFPSLVPYNVFSKTISQKCVLEIKSSSNSKTFIKLHPLPTTHFMKHLLYSP